MKNYYICVICQDRTDHLQDLLNSLVHASLVNEFHINFYIDSLDNYEPIYNESLVSYLQNYDYKYLFQSFHVHYQKNKLGTWNNKLFALYDSIFLGSDLTILLEDDLVIERDAFNFVVQTHNYLSERDIKLYSISLFSYNFCNEKLPYSDAKKYFEENEKYITSAVCANYFPTPWGIAFSKDLLLKLKESQWNGNDQSLCRFFKENFIINCYPAISRSYHLGHIKVSGKMILPHQHLKLCNNLNVDFFDYFNFLEDGEKKSNQLFSNLLNDYRIIVSTICFICDNEINKSIFDNLHINLGIHINVYIIDSDINNVFDEILSKRISNHFLISIKNSYFLDTTLLFMMNNNINYIIATDDLENSVMQLITDTERVQNG